MTKTFSLFLSWLISQNNKHYIPKPSSSGNQRWAVCCWLWLWFASACFPMPALPPTMWRETTTATTAAEGCQGHKECRAFLVYTEPGGRMGRQDPKEREERQALWDCRVKAAICQYSFAGLSKAHLANVWLLWFLTLKQWALHAHILGNCCQRKHGA